MSAHSNRSRARRERSNAENRGPCSQLALKVCERRFSFALRLILRLVRSMSHGASDSAEEQLRSFIEKFEPKHRAIIRAARKALLKVAAEQARVPLPSRGRGKLIIRSVAAKQRPRRKPQKPSQATRRTAK